MNLVKMLTLMMVAIILAGCGPSNSFVLKHADLDAMPKLARSHANLPPDVKFKPIIKNSFTREYNGSTAYFYQYDYVAYNNSGYHKVMFDGAVGFEKAGSEWIVHYGSLAESN